MHSDSWIIETVCCSFHVFLRARPSCNLLMLCLAVHLWLMHEIFQQALFPQRIKACLHNISGELVALLFYCDIVDN